MPEAHCSCSTRRRTAHALRLAVFRERIALVRSLTPWTRVVARVVLDGVEVECVVRVFGLGVDDGALRVVAYERQDDLVVAAFQPCDVQPWQVTVR